MVDRVDQRLADVVRAAVAYDEAERQGSGAKMTPRRKALVIAINDYTDAVQRARDDFAGRAATGSTAAPA